MSTVTGTFQDGVVVFSEPIDAENGDTVRVIFSKRPSPAYRFTPRPVEISPEEYDKEAALLLQWAKEFAVYSIGVYSDL